MVGRIVLRILKVFLFIALPFIVLIRGAIWFHINYPIFPWLSIAFGCIIVTIVLFLYFTYFYGRVTGKIGRKGWLKRRMIYALLLSLFYVAQSTLFLSQRNAKSTQVRTEFQELHPVLRVSISTFALLDRSLIITDGNRTPEDYRRMGLPTSKSSLHYKQSSGYAHAVDLRTRGKAEWKNWLMMQYFKWMGLNALRHIGTDDHLHISLYSKDHPHSI